MQAVRIDRALGEPFELTIADGTTTSEAFYIGKAAYGSFNTPTGMDSVAVTFLVAPTKEGTFVQCRKEDGTAASVTVADSGGYLLPAELFGHRWAKLVFGTVESPAKVITVSLGN